MNLTGKQQLSELETKRREEKTRIKKMETELAEKQTTSAFDTGNYYLFHSYYTNKLPPYCKSVRKNNYKFLEI